MMASRSLKNQWEYSRLAAERADRADVKAFALEIANGYEAANKELVNFETHLNLSIPPINDQDFTKRFPKLRALKGTEFDKAYLDEMAKASALDVSRYEGVRSISKDPGIKDYVDRTLPGLRSRAHKLTALEKPLSETSPAPSGRK
jgi:putative membrane protein